MWRSRRKSSCGTDCNHSIDGRLINRSCSKLNFIHSSFKDVELLFAEDDTNAFGKTLGQPSGLSPCSAASATAAAAATARRLSIFHRVHLANKFARAFSASAPDKRPPPESTGISAAEKSEKSVKSEKSDLSVKSEKPDLSVKSVKSEKSDLSVKSVKSELSVKSDRVISIPGAEKRVVVYTTSLRVVRPTFEACRSVKSILRAFRVSIDERDLSMDSRFLDELQHIMTETVSGGDGGGGGGEKVEMAKLTLPRVFIGGRYVGGAEEVRELHETGELKKLVEGLPAVKSGECEVCGDVRFIVCDECRGSHKCYTEKGGFRSCTLCNENGLIRCQSCLGG